MASTARKWTEVEDKKLLLALIKSIERVDYDALSKLFEGRSPKAVREHVAKLRAEAANVISSAADDGTASTAPATAPATTATTTPARGGGGGGKTTRRTGKNNLDLDLAAAGHGDDNGEEDGLKGGKKTAAAAAAGKGKAKGKNKNKRKRNDTETDEEEEGGNEWEKGGEGEEFGKKKKGVGKNGKGGKGMKKGKGGKKAKVEVEVEVYEDEDLDAEGVTDDEVVPGGMVGDGVKVEEGEEEGLEVEQEGQGGAREEWRFE